MIDAILFWIAAVFYGLAAFVLTRQKFYSLIIYLGSMALFFLFAGIGVIVPHDYLQLISALAIAVASSHLIHFPISLEWPARARAVYTSLLALSLLLALILFTVNRDTMLRVVQGYGFAAAVITAAYIFYAGSPPIRTKSMNIALTIALCSTPHLLIAAGLFASLSIPLIGSLAFGLPLIFALLSPFSFILSLHMSH